MSRETDSFPVGRIEDGCRRRDPFGLVIYSRGTMKLHYAHLSRWHYPQIFNTFMEAFADYAVSMSYLTRESLLSRWVKNAVDFKASVGAFDGPRLVGFTMLGIDDWMGSPAAFDAGTGIVKGYRGFGVAPEMFELAVEGLRARGIPTLLLEVIQTNRPAVRTYRKLGFKVTREFDCLRRPRDRALAKGGRAGNGVTVEAVGGPAAGVRGVRRLAAVVGDRVPGDRARARPGASVRRAVGRRVGRLRGVPPGAQLADERERQDLAPQARDRHRPPAARRRRPGARRDALKLINVDRSDAGMLSWARAMGFESYALQFEMALTIAAGGQGASIDVPPGATFLLADGAHD